MGSHCLKKQQTKEMSQIFANIRACTRPPLNSQEKVVRQRSETCTEIWGCTGKGSDRHGTGWPSAVVTAIAWHKGKLWARLSQINVEVHLAKLSWPSGKKKSSWLVTVEGSWLLSHAALSSLEFGWIMPQAQTTGRYFGCPRLQRRHMWGRDRLMALAFVAC